MATQINARQKGDRWQGLFFWQKAAPILFENSRIEKVSFEEGPKGFDDVVVSYRENSEGIDPYGRQVTVDHYQCKWQVGGNSFGWEDLIDPNFINASSISILERLRDAVENDNGTGRFILATTAKVKSDDGLEPLIGNDSGEILVSRLFDGTKTDQSKMGKIRKAWREKLDISDSELEAILLRFSVQDSSPNLDRFIDGLEAPFSSVGLKPIDKSNSVIIYDDLIWRWHSEGQTSFDANKLRELCNREALFTEHLKSAPKILGVRTFSHPIDDLSLRTDELLDLQRHFNGRSIKQTSDWNYSIDPALRSFLTENSRDIDYLRIILDTHYSVAVAAGATFSLKHGKNIEIEQRGLGRENWEVSPERASKIDPDCQIEKTSINEGKDLILIVSLTRNIFGDVIQDTNSRSLCIHSILNVSPCDRESAFFVKNADHAYSIAEMIVEAARKSQIQDSVIHLYYSGPNALAFYIGQLATPLRDLIIYEYDFEGTQGGGYKKGLCLQH